MPSDLQESRMRQRQFLLAQFQKVPREKSIQKIIQLMQETFPNQPVMKRSSIHAWFQRFRDGNLTTEDGLRNGRPPRQLDDRVGSEFTADPYSTTVDVACRLRLPWTRVKTYLQKKRIVNISGMWVPPLTEEIREQRLDYCREMIEGHSEPAYWDRVIFEGQRIIYYNKDVGKNGQRRVKAQLRCDNADEANLKLRSTLLRIWWTTGGFVHFQFGPAKGRGDGELYRKQLQGLYEEMSGQGMIEEREKWILHRNRDEAVHCPETVASFGWSEMLHPPNCPDISPTDYHLFMKYLAAFNTYNSFTRLEDIREFTQRAFERKKGKYFAEPVGNLVEKWHRIIETEGEYIGTHERVD